MENKKLTKEQVAKALAAGNDKLRKTLFQDRKNMVVVTGGVSMRGNLDKIREALRLYEPTEGDNPYGENDFGAVMVEGVKYYFKIDYYDENHEYGVDPYEDGPDAVYRVMTIMHESER